MLKKAISAGRKAEIILDVFIGVMIVVVALELSLPLFLHSVVVTGNSMAPTYKNQEHLLVRIKFSARDLSRGTVAIFSMDDYKDGEELVKRIIGVPGDTISFADGKCYINGEAEESEYGLTYAVTASSYTLGSDEYFVLGDNRENSSDSRYFGTVLYNEFDGVITDQRK